MTRYHLQNLSNHSDTYHFHSTDSETLDKYEINIPPVISCKQTIIFHIFHLDILPDYRMVERMANTKEVIGFLDWYIKKLYPKRWLGAYWSYRLWTFSQIGVGRVERFYHEGEGV